MPPFDYLGVRLSSPGSLRSYVYGQPYSFLFSSLGPGVILSTVWPQPPFPGSCLMAPPSFPPSVQSSVNVFLFWKKSSPGSIFLHTLFLVTWMLFSLFCQTLPECSVKLKSSSPPPLITAPAKLCITGLRHQSHCLRGLISMSVLSRHPPHSGPVNSPRTCSVHSVLLHSFAPSQYLAQHQVVNR